MPEESALATRPDDGLAPSVEERVLFEGHPAIVPSLGVLAVCVLTVGLATLYFWIRARAVRYKITTERLVVEKGLFSKRMDQIDIYRINDYVVEIPFSQRVLGTGNLVVTAMDKTNPVLTLGNLKTDVRALYEELRRATENEKRRRGVRMIDYE
ncbi:MAG TPA: PH domain-containing protein [Polyangiaceae bacterium]|nr:PH domain-containing protein [Polyangiaceae bacterium]